MNETLIDSNWLSTKDLANKYDVKVFDVLDAIDKLKKDDTNLEYIKKGRKKKSSLISETFISPKEDFLKKISGEIEKALNKRKFNREKRKVLSKRDFSEKEIEAQKKYKNLVPEDSLSLKDLAKAIGTKLYKIRKIINNLYKLKDTWDNKTDLFPIVKGLKLRAYGLERLYILPDKKSKKWIFEQLKINLKIYASESLLSFKDISEKTGLDHQMIKNFLRDSFEKKDSWDKDFEFPIIKDRKKHHSKEQFYLLPNKKAIDWLKEGVIDKNNLDFFRQWIDSYQLQRRLYYFNINIRHTLRRIYNISQNPPIDASSKIIIKRYNKTKKRQDFFIKNTDDNISLVKEMLQNRYGEPDFIPYRWKNIFIISNELNLSQKSLKTKLKNIYDNKENLVKKDNYFPLRKGYKMNSRIKTYYLEDSEKALQWLKTKLEEHNTIIDFTKNKIAPIQNIRKTRSKHLTI